MAQDVQVTGNRLQTSDGVKLNPSGITADALTGAPIEEVAVTAEAIHAALVTLGLITAPE